MSIYRVFAGVRRCFAIRKHGHLPGDRALSTVQLDNV